MSDINDDADKKDKGGLFGGKLSSWATKAKEAAQSAINSDKARAAIDEMKKRASEAGHMASDMAKKTGEKASEMAKSAEAKASSMMKKEDKDKEPPPPENKDQ